MYICDQPLPSLPRSVSAPFLFSMPLFMSVTPAAWFTSASLYTLLEYGNLKSTSLQRNLSLWTIQGFLIILYDDNPPTEWAYFSCGMNIFHFDIYSNKSRRRKGIKRLILTEKRDLKGIEIERSWYGRRRRRMDELQNSPTFLFFFWHNPFHQHRKVSKFRKSTPGSPFWTLIWREREG